MAGPLSRFIPVKHIGMPYHGLAVDGVLTTNDGNKAIEGDGLAVVTRNPAAPGANRNAAQQAIDAIKGYEWRDYALLTGPNRALNGGPQLGANAWLYYDGAGVPWLIDIVQTANGGTLTVEVWRRKPAFRIGRSYEHIPDALLATFNWQPVLPSWYTGAVTVENVVFWSRANNAKAILPNDRGSSVIINIHLDPIASAITSGVYDTNAINSETFAVVGVLLVSVSGTGSLFDGTGLSASISETHKYEPDIVKERIGYAATPIDTYPDLTFNTTSELPDHPGSFQGEIETVTTTTTWVNNNNGTYNGISHATGSIADVVLYVTHQGEITRRKEHAHYDLYRHDPGGAWASDVEWMWDGGQWLYQSCTAIADDLFLIDGSGDHDVRSTVFNIGGVSVDFDAQTYLMDAAKYYPSGSPYGQLYGCGDRPDYEELPDVVDNRCRTQTYAQSVDIGYIAPLADIRMINPHVWLVTIDYSTSDTTSRIFEQIAIGITEAGAVQLWQDIQTRPYEVPITLPPYEAVWSLQPVTGDVAHALSGVVYQYV